LQSYLESLCADLINASDSPTVRLTVESTPVPLTLNGLMSLSLIVAELVTNSLKHAFRGRDDGQISVSLVAAKGGYVLSVGDDGPGLPADFGKATTSSLGQGILQSLARQLHGKLVFENGSGTVARLIFHA